MESGEESAPYLELGEEIGAGAEIVPHTGGLESLEELREFHQLRIHLASSLSASL